MYILYSILTIYKVRSYILYIGPVRIIYSIIVTSLTQTNFLLQQHVYVYLHDCLLILFNAHLNAGNFIN